MIPIAPVRRVLVAGGAALAAALGVVLHVRASRRARGRPDPVRPARTQADASPDPASIIEALPAPVGYCGPDLRVRYVNRSFAALVGRPPADMVGRELVDLIPDYTPNLEARIRAAGAGLPQQFEYESRWPDGSAVHEVHYIPHLSATGQVAGFHFMAFDVSALRRSQDRLRDANAALAAARDQAEAAGAARSVFFANLSHEIRTPLNAITGLTQLLERAAPDRLQTDRLAKVSRAARHMLRVVNDSLDLAKIDAGKLVLKPVDFGRDVLVADTFEMVREEARRKGLELVIDTDHLPRRMRGDPTRLSQMLLNLLSNAVKFTEAGWVRLRGEWLNDPAENRLHLRFEVRDTGPGLTVEQQRRLYTAFEQGDRPAVPTPEGTGLGLALTRELARTMGGDAGVESEPGAGSAFWFTAWLDRADAAEDAAGFALDGLGVLIVDDLDASRQVIAAEARRLGLQVEAVDGGAAAIASLAGSTPSAPRVDALLIDWRMEGLDGLETLRRIRALLGPRTPPSILVTSADADDIAPAASAAGFDRVLAKPITPSALEDALIRLLGPEGRGVQPTAARPPQPSPAERQLRERHAGQRVLLAEDHPVSREITGEMLRIVGLAVEAAVDGPAALEAVRRRPFDLVLLDVRMPGLSGVEVARTLRREGHGLPLVAMTANAYADDRAACLAAGMNDHLAKPMTLEALYDVLLRWLPPGRAEDAGPGAAPPPAPAAGRPDPDAAPVLERLAAIDGFDPSIGLHSVRGDVRILVAAIEDFIDVYAGGLPPSETASLDDALLALRDTCHSLFGAAATIGARGIADEARSLERRLDADGLADEILAEIGRLGVRLRSFSGALKAALEPTGG